ncbi:transposase [Dyella jejuensis]|uniref:Transposase n=1 Tax=Dyella jejuensis TaxID=1432009 RepID=A0ABW8JMF2_9GAMM
MAINPAQLQNGLSMVEFVAQYGTQANCCRVLYRARWPQDFRCPMCANRTRSHFRRITYPPDDMSTTQVHLNL